jgi:hypothetical protein
VARVQDQYDRAVGRRWIVCAVVIWLCGCAQDQPKMPTACLDDRALPMLLKHAPAPARFADGKTKLSDCLVVSSDTADLQAFSVAVLHEATFLRRSARGDPGGQALVELGYLRGALHRGADAGLQDEFLRRFDDELLGVDTQSAGFRRGEAAGNASG